jgi:creatinine amidohydrolase
MQWAERTWAELPRDLGEAVAFRTKVPALPTLPYGCSLGHSRRFPGTIAIKPVTLIEFVKEIGDWAYVSGVRRLFIVNTHVTNAAPLAARSSFCAPSTTS